MQFLEQKDNEFTGNSYRQDKVFHCSVFVLLRRLHKVNRHWKELDCCIAYFSHYTLRHTCLNRYSKLTNLPNFHLYKKKLCLIASTIFLYWH